MKKIINWLKSSSHYKHIIVAAAVAFVFTFAVAMPCAVTWELCQKRDLDVFEWDDVLASAIGAVLGQIAQLLVIFMACAL